MISEIQASLTCPSGPIQHYAHLYSKFVRAVLSHRLPLWSVPTWASHNEEVVLTSVSPAASTHHLHLWHTADRACEAVPARTAGRCQLALSSKPTTDSSAPHQLFTSSYRRLPEVQPDSCHYLLTSYSKTRAKGKVGQSFWPGSPHCSPKSFLCQQRTQWLALPQGFQPAKIPTWSMFPRWNLSTHPLRDILEFPADCINHLSSMWSYYFSYSPVDTLPFPEKTAPVLLRLAHPTANSEDTCNKFYQKLGMSLMEKLQKH